MTQLSLPGFDPEYSIEAERDPLGGWFGIIRLNGSEVETTAGGFDSDKKAKTEARRIFNYDCKLKK